MGISLSVRPLDQQRGQLAVRFYSKWYCAMSGVNVLSRKFRLASNRYIVCEEPDNFCLASIFAGPILESKGMCAIFQERGEKG